VSIKGSPSRWFEAAVRRGDLAAALGEASELPWPLAPAYGLALVVLLGEAHDPRHGRWSARWAAQMTLQHSAVDLAVLGELVYLLEALAVDGDARLELVALGERVGVGGARALLVG